MWATFTIEPDVELVRMRFAGTGGKRRSFKMTLLLFKCDDRSSKFSRSKVAWCSFSSLIADINSSFCVSSDDLDSISYKVTQSFPNLSDMAVDGFRKNMLRTRCNRSSVFEMSCVLSVIKRSRSVILLFCPETCSLSICTWIANDSLSVWRRRKRSSVSGRCW